MVAAVDGVVQVRLNLLQRGLVVVTRLVQHDGYPGQGFDQAALADMVENLQKRSDFQAQFQPLPVHFGDIPQYIIKLWV